MPVEKWLQQELLRSLPDRNATEISKMSAEIFDALRIADEKQKSIQTAVRRGESKEG